MGLFLRWTTEHDRWEAHDRNVRSEEHTSELQSQPEISSLRILSQTELSKTEWVCSRYEQLNMIDEKHMTTMCHGQLYQRRAKQAFNKKVRPRVFEEGDLVLKKHNQALPDHKGKFASTYKCSYVVKEAFFGGALILADMDGHD